MGHWTLCVDLHWADWGDQWSLYQVASGETHFLSPIGAAILTQLESGSCDLDQLYARIVMQFDCPTNDDLRAKIATSLMRFDELGLIQRQTSNETMA